MAQSCHYDNNAGAISNANHTDDNYEKLAKGIGGYNQGQGTFLGNSAAWAGLLTRTTNTDAQDKAIRYAIRIMHNEHFPFGYRTYIWRGGTYPPVLLNNEGEPQLDTNGSPIPHPQAGDIWCFAYGESEWLVGTKYEDLKTETTRYAEGHPKTGDHDARVACE